MCVSTKWQPTCIHFLQYDDDNLYIYMILQVRISIFNQPSKPATKILSNLICSPQDLGDDTLVAWINGLRSTLVTCPFVLKGSTHEIRRDEAPLLQLGADIDRDLWHGNFRYNFTFLSETRLHGNVRHLQQHRTDVLRALQNLQRKCFKLLVTWLHGWEGCEAGCFLNRLSCNKNRPNGSNGPFNISANSLVDFNLLLLKNYGTLQYIQCDPTRSLRASCFIQCLSSVSPQCCLQVDVHVVRQLTLTFCPFLLVTSLHVLSIWQALCQKLPALVVLAHLRGAEGGDSKYPLQDQSSSFLTKTLQSILLPMNSQQCSQ